MAEEPATPIESTQADALAALFSAIDARVPFGPGFFLTHLHAFARDRCPDPSEALPLVEVHLDDPLATVLDVCHVIGVTPFWVALAVRDVKTQMRTELVPYPKIGRVTVRPLPPGTGHIGFDGDHLPRLMGTASPEKILEIAAGRRVGSPAGRS